MGIQLKAHVHRLCLKQKFERGNKTILDIAFNVCYDKRNLKERTHNDVTYQKQKKQHSKAKLDERKQ